MKKSLYEELGIDPDKDKVRLAFKELNNQEYPGAFVNIVTDPFEETRAMTQHQDGDGISLFRGYCIILRPAMSIFFMAWWMTLCL